MPKKLTRAFFNRDTVIVAQALLGKNIVRVINGVEHIVKIVETEAYLGPHDLASHTSRGLTERTKVMFGPPGHVYVYLIYGMYYCMNFVTEKEGHGSAVLIRAAEPVKNVEGRTQGPGLLCKALWIDKSLHGHDLISDDFYITEPSHPEKFTIVKKARVGIDYAKHWKRRLLRFYIKGNPFISKP